MTGKDLDIVLGNLILVRKILVISNGICIPKAIMEMLLNSYVRRDITYA